MDLRLIKSDRGDSSRIRYQIQAINEAPGDVRGFFIYFFGLCLRIANELS